MLLFLFLAGFDNNFEITNPNFVTTQGVQYDLDSVMHYGSRAFSRNGQATILPIDSSIMASRLGQRQGLSTKDLQHVMTLYCSGMPVADSSKATLPATKWSWEFLL